MEMITKTQPGFRCNRCSHTWFAKNINIQPVNCPKCHNIYWNRERKYNLKNMK
jgi:Zn finger protein HypA/HybF involved in hydrogenase expression